MNRKITIGTFSILLFCMSACVQKAQNQTESATMVAESVQETSASTTGSHIQTEKHTAQIQLIEDFYNVVYQEIPVRDEAVLRHYLSDRLIDRLDALTGDNENLILDYDPFIDAQDFERATLLRTFSVEPLAAADAFRVQFILFPDGVEQKRTVDLQVIKNPEGDFLIDDILSDTIVHQVETAGIEAATENHTGDKLLYDNEEVVYSFKTRNGKEMLIVKDTSNVYIKYRYGKNGNIEMEYPQEYTKQSWKKFEYNSYWRGGGAANSGMEIDNLQFTNNGYTYLVYRAYFAEDESNSAGIIITDPDNKEIRIDGDPKTIQGCICNLEDIGQIEKSDIGLSF